MSTKETFFYFHQVSSLSNTTFSFVLPEGSTRVAYFMAQNALKPGMVHVLVFNVLHDVALVNAKVEADLALPLVRVQLYHPLIHRGLQIKWF